MIQKILLHKRKLLGGLGLLILIGLMTTIWINQHVAAVARPYCYDSFAALPVNKVGLLLGTSKYTAKGHENLHYRYRIDLAVLLYKAGKIQYILASGDNSRRTYDEPTQMKMDLVARGIPADRVVLDYAGFRTLDSVVRARDIFGLTQLTIISQRFHNERAVYLARARGIEAVALNARDVTEYNGFKTKLREKFARVAAFLDLNLFHTQPKFLGETITIGPSK